MASAHLHLKHAITFIIFALLSFSALTTPADALNLSDVCPPASTYSPFKKWPSDLLLVTGPTKNSACWYWADCVITQSPEVRKQQFAATSLVMGLVPLILKDIAWPERRLAFISSPLNVVVEVIVRALGLVPVVNRKAKPVPLPRQLTKRNMGIITLALLTFSLLTAYAALVIMEFFSKRSSLGCPYPLFICT